MTTQDKPGRGDSRVMMWLGHYSDYLFLPVVVVSIATSPLPAGPWTWASLPLWIAWIFSLVVGGSYHSVRLCERCIASSPLDPQAAVERWRPALHWEHDRQLKIAMMLTVLAWIIGSNLAWKYPQPWWVYVLSALAMLALAGGYVATYQHRRLYPWCPWCHWDGGGEEEISPDVPAPAMSR